MIREIRILLVEDNPGDARLIREILQSTPYERLVIKPVATLRDGLIDLKQCDAILLDLSLPDSHGLDTLVKMREHAPDTAIIVLTGTEDENLGVQALQMGAQDYLPKGDLDGKLLRRAIHYAIERHRGELALRRSEQAYRSLIDDVFDTSMVAVIILDRALRVVWCNEATEVYFGIKREIIIGRDKRRLIDDELKCVFADPEDYASRLFRDYDSGTFVERFECHVTAAEGRQDRWLEHWSQPIRSGMYTGGRIEQYNDITGRKILEFAEREQRDFSEAMRDIATLLTSTLELKSVLERILSNLGRVIHHDSASITILEDDHIWIARHRAVRDTQEIVAERQLQTEYRHYLVRILETRRPVVVANLQDDEQVRATATQANVRAYLGVPVMLQDEIIGFVNAFSENAGTFDSHDAERLLAFAELAAIAIQNARLFQRSQDLAAVEVRQRLARELHDSVTQTLYTTQNMAESALRRWQKDPARAYELMESVYQLTRTALAEMRILLLELRPAALSQVSLKTLFEQYLQPIVDRRQFELRMSIDDVPPLPPDVQIALYRITQEALNNIDKHALAKHVNVNVRNDDAWVELQIVDDGRGFDAAGVESTSLGLHIMRERAEQIGAAIQIRSEVGAGTQITVTWDKKDLPDTDRL
jgi:two-component system nitrate/nitrite sensor histidine kinase NarX